MTRLANSSQLFAALLCCSLLGLGVSTVEAGGEPRWTQTGQRDHRPGYSHHHGPRKAMAVRERYYLPPRVVSRHYYPVYYGYGYRYYTPPPAVIISLLPVIIPLR